MREVTIRRFESSDVDQCRALWAELTQHHRDIYDDPSIGGDNPGLYFDNHLARVGPERIWVAERNGELAGLAGLIVHDHDAEVEPIIVESSHRGEGIGQKLLDRVMREAKKAGVRHLSVKPVARNTDAISFFYKAGFSTLGQLELFMDLQERVPRTWTRGPELFGLPFEY